MDISVLLSALNSAEQGAAESNPFSPAKSAAEGIGTALLQNAANFTPSENIWGGLATGLVSGLFGNLADTYQDKQSKSAQDLLLRAAAGESVFDAPRPDEMAPSVFSKLANTGNIFALSEQLDKAREKRQLEAQTAEAIAKAKALAPVEVETEVAKQKALLGLYGGIPASQRDEQLKQIATAQQTQKTTSAIDDYFEQAKNISSLGALIPGTTSANDMQGVQIGLTNMLQALQGREMNDSARKALQGNLPDWNDSVEQIEAKKAQFKQMMGAIAPSTPLVSGSVAMPGGNKIEAPIPQGAVAIPGKTSGGKQVYNVGGKLWVPD